MAIKLLQREEMSYKLLAVEKLNLLYNLLTSLFIVVLYDSLNNPQKMLTDRFFILLLTFVPIYIYTRFPCAITRFLRVAGQLSLLSYWYPDTFEFNRIFSNLDHLFAQIDLTLFGCQPALMFEQVCSSFWVREAFNLGYFAYYPMIATIVFYYFFARNREIERCTFVLVGSFYIYYIIYMFLPVAGPQFYFPVIDPALVAGGPYPEIGDYFNMHPEISIAQSGKGGLFTHLVGMAQASGERPTAAFPSSHIGISTVIMLLAIRAKRGLALALAPFFLLLCCATVYIKAHYLIDAFAGVATGLLFYLLTSKFFDKYMRG
ncbi:MAG: phosphatase PAP2 family protein [Bacteroidaceae bacterium]|nr:phosphatase PAP2 family protein [Bacteroidaceae bacterium]